MTSPISRITISGIPNSGITDRLVAARLVAGSGVVGRTAVAAAVLAASLCAANAAEMQRAVTIESPVVSAQPIDRGADGGATAERRLYVTGMVGSSHAVHGDGGGRGPVAGGLLSGGLPATDGAVGVAIPRSFGDVRLEFEGRSGLAAGSAPDAAQAGESWSVMANAWRDLPITEHLGGYVGGGVGAVGIPGEAGQRGGVAAQVGTGLSYAAHERMTFDVGYRFHVATPADGGRLPGNATALASSEMLLSVRLYDPFRSWLK
jgi:opacity protein-like surface antigen